ncbi:hypothetical protein GCM10023172_06170 [Hymenobacter ginsengisoli]|uniref:Lipoprotein n=1 Tax=Hymenobacter ginsengisoli TaxID=1051626 RepID=A0ABP8PZD4_9BACT|nr:MULTISPECIES: hypothetical protein [unclassified Hymenobacter]MBO2032735.1 hypothetical protein [Hymenobacter sp. BT559]
MKSALRFLTLSLLTLTWCVLLSTVLVVGACSTGIGKDIGASGPLPGSTAGGKPVGLFFFVSSSDFNNQRTYYFTPAGQVYVDPTDFSAVALAAVPPGQHGSYAVNGKQMTIKWANGSTTAGNYHADESGFSCEGSFMCVAPLASAKQLAGTFEGHNAAVSVNANSLAAFRTLTLKPDGTFTRDNFTASHSESRHSDKSSFNTDAASTGPQQAGRWKLDGWYLTLTDAQGTARGVAFRTDWDEKTDQTKIFRFNGTSYKNTNL